MRVETLPIEIRESGRAVVWNREERDGKATKVPYCARRPAHRARVDDPTTWALFHEAVAAVEDGKCDGPGVVLGAGLFGVDLDACRDPTTGAIDPTARAIIEEINSYTEISPSGCGVHILGAGTLPPGRRRHGRVEMYSDGRFFTVTGQHVAGTPATIEERTAAIAALHARVFPVDAPTDRPRPTPTIDDDDATLIARMHAARNGGKVSSLWTGDLAGYTSASEADLALCSALAFWTQCDASRMDRLFRQSGLMRDKWDRRHGRDTYGNLTIDRAIVGCRETYTGARPSPITSLDMSPRADGRDPEHIVDEPPASPPPPRPPVDPPPYTFPSVFPATHFVSRYLAYASRRTDAPHEYHEAAALVLLASMTPRIRARLSAYPKGIGTNLYVLLIGDSTTSRKSTAKNFAVDLQAEACPGSLCPDHFSPEGLIESLASRPNDTSTLYIDEFAELLAKLHHAKYMAGVQGLFLTIYGGDDYVYRRHSKRSRRGAAMRDEDVIRAPHLSILGATTPSVFTQLNDADIISGLVPRFAIVLPASKPPRMPIAALSSEIDQARTELVTALARLTAWAHEMPRLVEFDAGVIAHLDGFAAALERDAHAESETGQTILQRLPAMCIKLALLAAAGREDACDWPTLTVTAEDATAAAAIAARWQRDALRFAIRVGENVFERNLQKCSRMIADRRQVPRRVIAMNCHVDKKMLDLIEATLADRGLVEVRTAPKTRRVEWIWRGVP